MTDTTSRIVNILSMPLDGVQQIEASAGTGKTYTIAGLYARLIIERKLELRQILVMTFTKAAIAELRQRLRQRLLLCADLAENLTRNLPLGDALDDESATMLALLQRALDAGETAPALAARLRQAVQGMDESAILTIHGFCQRVLREHAALLGSVSADVEVTPGDEDLLEDFAADAWLRISADKDPLLREALLALGSTPEDLVKTLQQLVDFGGSIEPAAPNAPLPTPKDPENCRETIYSAWAEGADEAVALFERAFSAGHFLASAFPRASDEDLYELAAQLRERQWPTKVLLAKFAASQFATAMKQKAPAFAGHRAFDAIEVWHQACLAREDAVRARVPQVLHRLVAEARVWLR
ncbi:MAG: UvrD-helicase domain-containing protein, partial [Xanthomonadales bacterium]|nr:UvrD-helicase domain-containing protein [Xanthomonadales bacterium]